MKKIALIFLSFIIFSCQENSFEEPAITDLEQISNDIASDRDFQNFISSQGKIRNKINDRLTKSKSDSERNEYDQALNQLYNDNKIEKLSIAYGFDSHQEYLTLGFEIIESINNVYEKYELHNLTDNEINQIIGDAVILLMSNKDLSNGRTGNCYLSFLSCTRTAEEDYFIGSATCAAGGTLFGPGGWALCQGSVNLVYSADGIACMYNYDECEQFEQ